MKELLQFLAERTPEAEEAIKALPPDVQAVVADFRRDYLAALNNFKEAYLSMFSWALEAQCQLHQLKTYLEMERMRGELGDALEKKVVVDLEERQSES